MINTFLIFLALFFFASLSYWRRSSAVVLLFGLLPSYFLRINILGLPTNFFELAVLIVFISFFLKNTTIKKWRKHFQQIPSSILFLSLFFIISAIVSTLVSPHPLTSSGVLKSWIVIPVLFSWLVFVTAQSPRFRHALYLSLIASGTAMATFALPQVFTLERVKGIYAVPNSLALFLTPIFIVTLFTKNTPLSPSSLQKAKGGHSCSDRPWQFCCLKYLPAFIIGLALVSTQSAAAIISIGSVLIVSLFISPPPYRQKALAALIVLLIITVGYFYYSGRLSYLASPLLEGRANSISVRFQLWSVSLDLIKENFFLGTGLGTFEPAYQQKLHQHFQQFENCNWKNGPCLPPLPEFVFRDPHNWILSFWLNTGLLGLVSFAGIHILIIGKIFHVATRQVCTDGCTPGANNGNKLRTVDHGLPPAALALLTLLIFGLFDTTYWKNDLSALHWALVAIFLATCANCSSLRRR